MSFALPLLARKRPAESRNRFWASLSLNLRVLGALMMREGTMRYGHENLGFFWVMGEPIFLTIGVIGMWTITGATHGHSVGIVPFALTGYSHITLWRHLTAKAVRAIRNNTGLLFHRNVRVFDILLARALLEIVGIFTAFMIAYVPLALLGFVYPIRDPLILIGGYVLNAWFSMAVGLIISAVAELSESVEQFVPPILYITIPFTGSFYMASWLPEKFRDAVLWSPLVNAVEMFRAGLFPEDIVTYWYPWYVVVWCVALTALALPLIQYAQKHVAMR
jgi:capsular polysaccharide transport system permease protein